MEDLNSIGRQVAAARRNRGLRQIDLASHSGLSRATIDALENGRATDIGFSKLNRILAVLGLEFSIHPFASRRPTLEELQKENLDD